MRVRLSVQNAVGGTSILILDKMHFPMHSQCVSAFVCCAKKRNKIRPSNTSVETSCLLQYPDVVPYDIEIDSYDKFA